MNIVVYPHKLSGVVNAVCSKSEAHRILICAAFSNKPSEILCPDTSDDIEATVSCLQALGADIHWNNGSFFVKPVKNVNKECIFNCKESGSTLRFLLPIAGALGIDATFLLSGNLPERPLSPLWEVMEKNGCHLTWLQSGVLRCTGRLQAGGYHISGSVSSQFITGLLFALSMIPGKSSLKIHGKLESAPYVSITKHILQQFGVNTDMEYLSDSLPFYTTGRSVVEGDWSNAAFFLAANLLGSDILITGLNPSSKQGDRAITDVLSGINTFSVIDGSDIPDLVPILAVVAAAHQGAIFHNIGRLRFKESDRIASVCNMLKQMGIQVESSENSLHVFPGNFNSCTIDACGDHRIAMACAIAATVASGPVEIIGAECVKKSYPSFWQDYGKLGGQYEQLLW